MYALTVSAFTGKSAYFVDAMCRIRHVWLAQGVGNVNVFVRVFKQCLCDNNVQNWNSRIENSSHSTFL